MNFLANFYYTVLVCLEEYLLLLINLWYGERSKYRVVTTHANGDTFEAHVVITDGLSINRASRKVVKQAEWLSRHAVVKVDVQWVGYVSDQCGVHNVTTTI